MDALRNIWQNLDWSFLVSTLISVVSALTCITLHELAHGFAAYRLGDNTAKYAGRLTLNPLRHIDPLGLVMMVVFRFGWAKPVPVDMRQFKSPRRDMAITALAGPAMNILLALFSLVLYGALFYPLAYGGSLAGEIALTLLSTISYLSTALAVFNLLPVPPLDGSKILGAFLPESAYRAVLRYERYGMLALFALLAIMRRTSFDPLSAVTDRLYDLLFNAAVFAAGLASKIM